MSTRFTSSLFLFLFLSAVRVHAQDSAFARKVIDTLTSPTMNGRGYVNDGANKAANYISDKFSQFHLVPFSENYFQTFNMDVNTFPCKLSVTLNGKLLRPGKDFLISPNSSGCSGDFKIVSPNWNSLFAVDAKKKLVLKKNNFILIDKDSLSKEMDYSTLIKILENHKNFGASGIIELDSKKLTWDISQKAVPYCHIVFNKDSVPGNLKKLSVHLENKLLNNYQTKNVIGFVKGKINPDSFIVLSAHYDHLGQMGDDTYFPGANDNASGISMLISLAYYYSQPEHQPKYSIVFMAFSGEEVGLVGSEYYTEHPLFPLSHIRFLVNMDIVGTGEEGIKAVNGSVHTNEFDKLVKLNDEHHYLKSVQVRGKAANSDHYYFTESSVPAFFIYTLGGISAYHDLFDRDETLPLTKFNNLEMLLKDFIGSF